jgi:Zn-dependent protease with chaperone function
MPIRTPRASQRELGFNLAMGPARVMLARVWVLASANFAMLLGVGVAYRGLKSAGSLADAPSTMAVQAAGFSAFGPGGVALVIAVLLGFFGAFAGLALSKPLAKRILGARVVSEPAGDDETWLLGTVRMLAARYRVAMPEVAIHDSAKHSALATGLSRDRALLTLSSGLLGARGRKDVEGLLSHELSHVASGKLVTFALIQGALNALVVFALAA